MPKQITLAKREYRETQYCATCRKSQPEGTIMRCAPKKKMVLPEDGADCDLYHDSRLGSQPSWEGRPVR